MNLFGETKLKSFSKPAIYLILLEHTRQIVHQIFATWVCIALSARSSSRWLHSPRCDKAAKKEIDTQFGDYGFVQVRLLTVVGRDGLDASFCD
jgi:hypothetical protein